MDSQEFDVLVIGAGAAGMMAALEMANAGKRVGVLEAKDRTGGRMVTVEAGGLAVELGAEFVHGNLPLTKELLQKAGAALLPVKGSLWQKKAGRMQEQEDFIEDFDALGKKFRTVTADKSVSEFLEKDLAGANWEALRVSLRNYVEGYYAADTAKASTAALIRELAGGGEEQYRISGGYQVLVNFLEQDCREKGVAFFLSHPVQQVRWKQSSVAAITNQGTFNAQKMLLTVPVGVLQQKKIMFFPPLHGLEEPMQKLGFGHVQKVVLVFSEAFWKDKTQTGGEDLSGMSFLFSEEELPTWWSYFPAEAPVLTGWLGGPAAEAARFSSNEVVIEKALSSLGRIFQLDPGRLQEKLRSAHFYNWSADDHICGAYSYEVVGGDEAIRLLQQPIENTLFFAGEGLQSGPQIGTVEGALQNGRDAARRLVSSFVT